MRRVLLTGATGAIGANLARRLLADGHDVHLLVRPGFASWRIDAIVRDLRLHIANLHDAEATRDAVRVARPDWIFHLATHGAYASQTDVQEIIRTNISGTVNLVDAALAVGIESFIHTGSSSEYGVQSSPPSEDHPLDPNSPYAVAKAAATMYGRHISQSRDVHVATLRLYSVYGPFEAPTRLLPTVIVRGLAGTLPPLVNPDIARDFVHVDDVVAACLAVAARTDLPRGSIFNVGTGIQTTIRDVVAIAKAEFGLAEEPRWGSMPDRRWDTTTWIADPGRLQQAVGWHASTTFVAGFRRMADWLRNDPQMRDFYERALSAGSTPRS